MLSLQEADNKGKDKLKHHETEKKPNPKHTVSTYCELRQAGRELFRQLCGRSHRRTEGKLHRVTRMMTPNQALFT